MWIKPLRSMVGTYGRLHRNTPANLEASIAEKLVAKGLAVPHSADSKGAAKPANPPKAARSGGKTGQAKPSRSSQADQA